MPALILRRIFMPPDRESLKPMKGSTRNLRRKLSFKDELLLALLPTLTILAVLLFVEVLNRQKFLFSALAASAFLIYLDPLHGTNAIRTPVMSHLSAAATGLLMYKALGPGYISGGSAMIITILFMIFLDAVHPPAVRTFLIFAFRVGSSCLNRRVWVPRRFYGTNLAGKY